MKITDNKGDIIDYKLEKKNDSIFSILLHSGIPLKKIWDFADNKGLKDKRKSPFFLIEGDVVHVPKKKCGKDEQESGHRILYRTEDLILPIIDIYLGFMDEEVNARLERLINSQKNKGLDARPVILIERGKLDFDKPILEWQIGNYQINPSKIINISPTKKEKKGLQGGDEAPENVLAQAMAVFMEQDIKSDLDWLARGLKVKRYFDIIKLLQHRGVPKTKSKLPENATGEGPWMSVVRFGVGNNENAPIIVIRTPEMGLQPSLMCPYISFLFKAISAMSSQLAHEQGHKWEWPLRVSQFGAQGSSSSDRPPGSEDTVVASLFVGVEIASEISIAAQEGGKSTKFRYQPSKDSETEPHWIKEGYDPPKKEISKNHHDYQVSEKNEKKLIAYAVISLCTPAGIYDFVRQKIEGYGDLKASFEKYGLRGFSEDEKTQNRHKEWMVSIQRNEVFNNEVKQIQAAQDLAMDIYRAQYREDRRHLLKLKECSLDKNSPYFKDEEKIKDGNPTLEKVIKAFKKTPIGTSGEITLTVSYFGGGEDKDAADVLGIKGVAMEDYHVLKVLRTAITKGVSKESDYPLILKWRIDRINCDPKTIEDEVINMFNQNIQNPYLKIEDYVNVIIWGLGGVLKDKVPPCAIWKFTNTLTKEQFRKHLWAYDENPEENPNAKEKSNGLVTDPFCIEIATDFINELAEIDPKKDPSGGITKIKDRIAGEEIDKENILKELKKKADDVRKAWPDDLKTRQNARDLMAYLGEHFEFKVDDGLFKTWLRPGKWSGIEEATTQDLGGQKFGGAAVDRAFYKSCNMMALQKMADHYFYGNED